ncbi:MAG: hypothetical protein H7Z43_10295 [Clostridia bacterium]|nr:hypothetical protein [Deltaproteobacteria bacterium]
MTSIAPVCLALTLLVCNSGHAAKPLSVTPEGPPDFRELLQILMRNQAFKLGSAVHHDGCVESETLGDYLATLIANSAEGDRHALGSTCALYDAARSKLHPPRYPDKTWECRLTALSVDREGSSPWRYELVVLIDQTVRKLDTRTLACPGSG